jgi:hypothetical protein
MTLNNIDLPIDAHNDRVDLILHEFDDLFNIDLSTYINVEPVKLKIKPNSYFKKSFPRFMTPLKRDFINSKVKDLLEAGIISKLVEGSNICAYPVVVVAHPQTKKLRMCIDFVELNKLTEDFTFPLPNIKEILNRLANKKVYAKLDLSQGFHQLRIHEDSKKYLVFITQDGLYKWERLPFGPKQGPGLFQQVMFIILDELRGVVCEIYLDDIIIYME